MTPSIDLQIESLVEAHDRRISRLHLGCSPYDEDPDDETWTEARKRQSCEKALDALE